MSKTFSSLRDVREKLLGYRFESVVHFAPIEASRLEAIEAGETEPTFLEMYRLARLYGLDVDTLCEEPIVLAPGDGVTVLTSLQEFKELGDATRSRIVLAANAAKDLIWLYKMSGQKNQRAQFLAERPSLSLKGSGERPHRQGASLARQLRLHLQLKDEPIPSLRTLVAEQFPSLSVLYSDLGGDQGPAGLGFADAVRGPVIVLNTRGKNENPWVRRFSLAHELCHLLVDWNGQDSLASISGYFDEHRLAQEQRANAFAVRLLCPPRIVQKLDLEDEKASRRVIEDYGIPYAAWRLYVRNERKHDLPEHPPWLQLEHAEWDRAEKPPGIDGFPLDEVPTERRTLIAELAARLYSKGKLSRDAFAEILGVTPASDLERVLDSLALNLPDSSSETAA